MDTKENNRNKVYHCLLVFYLFHGLNETTLLDRELHFKTIVNKTIERVDNAVYCSVSPITTGLPRRWSPTQKTVK